MAEPIDPQPTLTRAHAVDWGRVTPVVHLFQCFRVAMQPSKILLSWVAVMGVWAVIYAAILSTRDGLVSPSAPRTAEHFRLAFAALRGDGGWPLWLAVFLLLLVATSVGLGVCRMAAARLCTGENIGPVAAAGFVARKGPWAMLAPVIPGVVIVGVGIALALLGLLLFSLPWLDVLGGLLFGPMLLAGLGAAVVVAALLLSYPLMAAAVAVEGTDAFDTMSRCFAYLTAKPWSYLFYALVAALYGAACFGFLWLLVEGAIRLTACLVEAGAIGSPSAFREALAYADGPASGGGEAPSTAITGWLVWFWLVCLRALPLAFAFSFACTASTMIYLLLRRGADGTAFDDCDLIAKREDPVGAAPLGEGTEAVTTPGSKPEPNDA
ncbi:hypothetical protein [Phycisphaera mikurensis]|uniref:Hypothetical membrane protein n=1 Tax=Phycisphaera mikurensis (strain NBRC 102666 / KCTC 22515 / FYK2301M01) TaxID=1142394 RepID=I0IG73_PHYMF|nr:hypothetical protein [Phycisphaera mikurensis]MBB6440356.1 hypothetical protein [Phycisphaera mikurensis]BAM04261.1 hypothetical membrane protein [Phycisphaera mikurensis NBRC 102666]